MKRVKRISILALALVLLIGAVVPQAHAACDYSVFQSVYSPSDSWRVSSDSWSVIANVAYSPVQNNAGNGYGSHPTGLETVKRGKEIYYNFQIDNRHKIKSVTLYITPPGGSQYKYQTKTANNYLRYTWFWFSTSGKKTGTYKYTISYKFTNGRTWSVSDSFKLV